jgi:hypothetical protein
VEARGLGGVGLLEGLGGGADFAAHHFAAPRPLFLETPVDLAIGAAEVDLRVP